jgi:hypothetical protein
MQQSQRGARSSGIVQRHSSAFQPLKLFETKRAYAPPGKSPDTNLPIALEIEMAAQKLSRKKWRQIDENGAK